MTLAALVGKRLTVLAAGAVLSTAAIGAPWVDEGRVVGVSDGDTITLLDEAKGQHKVRPAGIDAPEKGQAFQERSKQGHKRL